jgi:RNA polymerase sigma factor (TIGR02999 family)
MPPERAVRTAVPGTESETRAGALDALFPAVYDDLRRIAAAYLRREPGPHTLAPTALVHEAYLRLTGQRAVAWNDRAQIVALAATMMRRVLVNHAEARQAAKRGGGAAAVTLDDDAAACEVEACQSRELLALDAALHALAALDARQARVVELRFFAGLGIEETAAALGVSSATVKREWNVARAWLRREVERAR